MAKQRVKVNWTKRYVLANLIRGITTISFHAESELWALVKKKNHLEEGFSPAELKLMEQHLKTLHDLNVSLSFMSQRLFNSIKDRRNFDDQ